MVFGGSCGHRGRGPNGGGCDGLRVVYRRLCDNSRGSNRK
jgi:hypothetical protein